ncbi:MAG TPA: hypothetical protein GX506_05615 [Firmicutes bacterium]|nr:hypothetical protein [Bacillota bacterium]
MEEILRQEGIMDEDQVQAIFEPEELTSPGVAGIRAMMRRRRAFGGGESG